MNYQRPTVIDHGTIADHTFTNSGSDGYNDPERCQGVARPAKDYNECKLDCFDEWSCPSS